MGRWRSKEERWVGGAFVNVLFCRRTHVKIRQSPTWKMLKCVLIVMKLWKMWCECPMNIVKCVKMNSSCWNLILLSTNYLPVVKIFPYPSYRRDFAKFFSWFEVILQLWFIYDILFVCVISPKKFKLVSHLIPTQVRSNILVMMCLRSSTWLIAFK